MRFIVADRVVKFEEKKRRKTKTQWWWGVALKNQRKRWKALETQRKAFNHIRERRKRGRKGRIRDVMKERWGKEKRKLSEKRIDDDRQKMGDINGWKKFWTNCWGSRLSEVDRSLSLGLGLRLDVRLGLQLFIPSRPFRKIVK